MKSNWVCVYQDINHNTDYQTFRRKWGSDPRFEAIERKEREVLLNERYLISMLQHGIDVNTSWFCLVRSLDHSLNPKFLFIQDSNIQLEFCKAIEDS